MRSILVVLVCLVIGAFSFIAKQEIDYDYTVYTNTDILYISNDQITVWTEKGGEHIFHTHREMADWIERETADAVNIWENVYLVDVRDYPDDCFDVYSDYDHIGYFCPTSEEGVYQYSAN